MKSICINYENKDDDFQLRMFNSKLCIMRPTQPKNGSSQAPFLMLKHVKSNSNTARYTMLSGALNRQFQEGLNDIDKIARVDKVTHFRSFTHLSIVVSEK